MDHMEKFLLVGLLFFLSFLLLGTAAEGTNGNPIISLQNEQELQVSYSNKGYECGSFLEDRTWPSFLKHMIDLIAKALHATDNQTYLFVFARGDQLYLP